MGSQANRTIYTVTNETVICDYDFTKRASHNLNAFIASGDIDNNGIEAIMSYLFNNAGHVRFSDQLKRYVFNNFRNSFSNNEKYGDVKDSEYAKVIRKAFKNNNAPLSMEKSSVRPSVIINRWLSQGAVRRDAVFALGFGLGMTDSDVDMFLKKAINDWTFNYTDHKEVIYKYCYARHLPYTYAGAIIERYENGLLPEPDSNICPLSPSEIKDITDERTLFLYLGYLKKNNMDDNSGKKKAYDEFTTLCTIAKQIIAESKNEYYEDLVSQTYKMLKKSITEASDISLRDIEMAVYPGIAVTGKGNMKALKGSSFCGLFDEYRLTRQRIDAIIKKKITVDRYDLLTLLFFNYLNNKDIKESIEYGGRDAEERKDMCKDFLAQANQTLNKVGMISMYTVNPYESFLLLCMVSEDPWESFCEAWEKSYIRHK